LFSIAEWRHAGGGDFYATNDGETIGCPVWGGLGPDHLDESYRVEHGCALRTQRKVSESSMMSVSTSV
jgi:hypothetical protein